MSVRAGILLGPAAILWFFKGRDAILPACPLMPPTFQGWGVSYIRAL